MFTRLSKVLAGLLVLAFAVEFFIPDTSNYIALVPGRTLPCVWNLVTCGLLHTNIVELVISVAALLGLARVVEPVYGSKEFLKFIAVVDLMVGSVVFVAVYIGFATTANGNLLYQQFMGFQGIIAALLVAVKQIMPLHEIKLFGTFKLKMKYVPSVVLLVVTALALLLNQKDYLIFYVLGTYLGWLYLRFFQQQPDSPFHGDNSDEFKFSSFFPDFLAAPVDLVGGALGFITRLRHVPGEREPVIKGLGGPSVLGADAADASRRRERGAKALEERLGLKAAASGGAPAGTAQVAAKPDVESGEAPGAATGAAS